MLQNKFLFRKLPNIYAIIFPKKENIFIFVANHTKMYKKEMLAWLYYEIVKPNHYTNDKEGRNGANRAFDSLFKPKKNKKIGINIEALQQAISKYNELLTKEFEEIIANLLTELPK